MNGISRSLLIASVLGTVVHSQAFYTVLDTSDIMKSDKQRLQLAVQGITSPSPYARDGANVRGRYDKALNEDTEIQFELGTGQVEFNAGVFGKYRFTQEDETWASFSIRGGYSYSNLDDYSLSSITVQPLASKKFESSVGVFAPYVSIPVNIAMYRNNTKVPIQLAIGTEFRYRDWENFRLIAEYSGNAVDAFNSVSAGASFDF